MPGKTYTVSRAGSIKAPMDRVHALINDFHNWPTWSPWENVDSNLEREYAGPDSGRGAAYKWRGDKEAGEGTMLIIDSGQDRIEIELTFLKPFKSESEIDFDLEEEGGVTSVTWKMTGPLSLPMRLMTMFKSFDSMIGPDFERGLAQLKQVAEAAGERSDEAFKNPKRAVDSESEAKDDPEVQKDAPRDADE